MTDRIAEIRREIEQGTYETAERVDGAVERIVEIMRIPPTYDRVARMSNTSCSGNWN